MFLPYLQEIRSRAVPDSQHFSGRYQVRNTVPGPSCLSYRNRDFRWGRLVLEAEWVKLLVRKDVGPLEAGGVDPVGVKRHSEVIRYSSVIRDLNQEADMQTGGAEGGVGVFHELAGRPVAGHDDFSGSVEADPDFSLFTAMCGVLFLREVCPL